MESGTRRERDMRITDLSVRLAQWSTGAVVQCSACGPTRLGTLLYVFSARPLGLDHCICGLIHLHHAQLRMEPVVESWACALLGGKRRRCCERRAGNQACAKKKSRKFVNQDLLRISARLAEQNVPPPTGECIDSRTHAGSRAWLAPYEFVRQSGMNAASNPSYENSPH